MQMKLSSSLDYLLFTIEDPFNFYIGSRPSLCLLDGYHWNPNLHIFIVKQLKGFCCIEPNNLTVFCHTWTSVGCNIPLIITHIISIVVYTWIYIFIFAAFIADGAWVANFFIHNEQVLQQCLICSECSFFSLMWTCLLPTQI